MVSGGVCWKYTKSVAAVIRKECFTDMLRNSSFFYFIILLWIFLVIVNIGIYGVLLLGIVSLKDNETQELYKNIFIQIINGLFTFTALANLPVRIQRFRMLYIVGGRKKSDMRRPSCTYMDESAFIFDHLDWTTRHVIIQGLLWNCIFQLINQVTRCVYYSAVSASEVPGVIWVNVFFPLSILMALIAAFVQAVAENRFRQQNSLEKETTCKKTLTELWYKLWKVQTEAYVGFANNHEHNSPKHQCVIFKLIENLKEKQVSNGGSLSIDSKWHEDYRGCTMAREFEVNDERVSESPKIQELPTPMVYSPNPKFVETIGTKLLCPNCGHKFRVWQDLQEIDCEKAVEVEMLEINCDKDVEVKTSMISASVSL